MKFTAFASDLGDAQGNPCLVERVQARPGDTPQPAETTLCRTWSLGQHRAGVRCWTGKGEEIQCCGHGLLSCAAWWMTLWGGEGTLVMGRSEIPCRQTDDLTWLGFARISCRYSGLPDWAHSHFGATPVAAALAGPDDGYMILRWPDNFQLTQLRVPLASLGDHTRRAVIATCRHSDSPAAVGLRYFAPQYGTPEDTATGSAMRVLADFWAMALGFDALHGRQDSPRGGELFSRIEGDIAWVGGRVKGPGEASGGATGI